MFSGMSRKQSYALGFVAVAVVTVVLGVTILDETLAPSTVVGGVLVLLGVTLVQVSREQREWVLAKVGLR